MASGHKKFILMFLGFGVIRAFNGLTLVKHYVKTILGHAAFDSKIWCNLAKAEIFAFAYKRTLEGLNQAFALLEL